MPELHHNYLPQQYETTGALPINHNYLPQQFEDPEPILEDIRELVRRGDYTLGRAVDDLEAEFCRITGTEYAIGVGSGTDAIFLSLKAAGVDKGDEVITVPYTFFATVGAIVTAGARPVFADVGEDYNLDPEKLEAVITPKTKAIVPVHWSGLICDMERIHEIASRHGIPVIEDACHAINAERDGKRAGAFSATACFSMHPLKNLNVWGDGGVICTNSKELHNKLVLLRNHGLVNRDICEVFAYNSRLDTLQAIVGSHLLKRIDTITDSRIANAAYLDSQLGDLSGITLPTRHPGAKHVYHIYVIRSERRDELVGHLIANEVDAKVHYPVPMHLQPAARDFGYKEGDFPVSEAICKTVFSLPVHEYITPSQRETAAAQVRAFFS